MSPGLGCAVSEERYHLVFRGEVLEGQHVAVVGKRLAALLKMDPAKASALFSGKPVVLKRDAPRDVAAKYQAAFKKAGARLRIAPAKGAAEEKTAAAAMEPAAPQPAAAPDAAPKKLSLAERLAAEAEAEAATAREPASTTSAAPVQSDPPPAAAGPVSDGPVPSGDGISLAPAGGDLVSESEHARAEPVVVDTSHLTAAPAGEGSLEDVVEHLPPPPAPDVSAISLADLGEDLDVSEGLEVPALDAPDFGLAEAGAEIEVLAAPPPPPAPDPDFAVADVGADLDTAPKPPPPPPPDTSHLRVEAERASFAVPD